MDAGNWITIISIIIASIALICQINGMRKQITIRNFADYTKRYQAIILNFPEEVNEPDFNLKAHTDYKKTMRYMRAYFDLCYEEYYLHQRNFIDKKIWNIWCAGMQFAFTKAAFKQAWAVISIDTDYGSEFKSFVSKAISNK